MPDGSVMFRCPPLPIPEALPTCAHTSRPTTPVSRPATRPSTPSVRTRSAFRLGDLAPELQELILVHASRLPQSDLFAASMVCSDWHERFVQLLYASLSITKANREAVLAGLGIDFLTPMALEARASEAGGCAAYTRPGLPKTASLAHVKRLTLADSASAASLAETLLAHGNAFPALEELHLGPQAFRYLVNTLASFGRPRSGSAFVGETLVSKLHPRRLFITFPPSRGHAGSFDPVLLARVTALLVTEWAPDMVEYHGVGTNFPPALGPTGIHFTNTCTPFDDVYEEGDGEEADGTAGGGCRAHSLVRMHLRRTFGHHARAELLEAIAEAEDPTDDKDLDPDSVPDPAAARVEYHGVPCIAAADADAFLDKTFAHWPVEVDVAAQVKFFP